MAIFDFPATPTDGQTYDTGTGIIYTWNAAAGVWLVNTSGSTTLLSNIKRTVITATGAGAYVKPAGLKFVDVELVAAGGTGGVAGATAAAQAAVGAGGGGGGYVKKLYKASDLAASEPYFLGAIGSGSGTDGADSTFKGLTAGGGKGGGTVAASTSGPSQVNGGVGGIATGGDLNIPGSQGTAGGRNVIAAATASPGMGGASALCAARAPRLFLVNTTNGPFADTGMFPGGGGEGAANGASQAGCSGGLGGAPCLILTEYF